MPTRRDTLCPRCGKHMFGSEAEAKDAVVQAKIKMALRGNTKRREQRAYPCPHDPNIWHATSQPLELPTYAADDDEAANEFIGQQVRRPAPEAWEALLAPDRARQTLRVLGAIDQKVQATAASKRAEHSKTQVLYVSGQITQAEMHDRTATYDDWKRRAQRFRLAVSERLEQAREAARQANIAESEERNRADHAVTRDALRRLTLAVDRHRADTAEPNEADKTLWAALDTITAPNNNQQTTLAELLAGQWFE